MSEILAELFSSKVRAQVLGQMLPRAHLGFSLTELSRILGLPISSLQHECYKLERIEIIKGRREGNSRRYRVNAACPILPQLTALVVKGIGEAEALRAALEDIPGLDAAFLATPKRFKGLRPTPSALPTAAWINPPPSETADPTSPQPCTVNS